MQFDRDFVFAGVFDRALQHNFVSIDLCADFVFEPIHDVLRGDRSKCLAGLAGLQCKSESHFADATREFFRLVQFARFAFGAFLLERIRAGARSPA